MPLFTNVIKEEDLESIGYFTILSNAISGKIRKVLK